MTPHEMSKRSGVTRQAPQSRRPELRTHAAYRREGVGAYDLFVWLVPFSLFVSLSINDNELPLGAPQAPRSSSAFRALCDMVRGAYGRTVAPAVQRGFHESHGKRY